MNENTHAESVITENTPIENSQAEAIQEGSEPQEALPDYESLISELNSKISSLNEELEGYKTAIKRQELINEQISEFSELFPSIAINAIPDEVWSEVKKGSSLAASYAVYEKRITEAARKIESVNLKNASSAAGSVGKHPAQEFFSPDDVRKMSPSEVRASFAKIKRSMEKWN